MGGGGWVEVGKGMSMGVRGLRTSIIVSTIIIKVKNIWIIVDMIILQIYWAK